MKEAEQLIRPLEEVFDSLSCRNLRSNGVNGVIPIEILIGDLISIAKEKWFDVDGVGAGDSKSVGFYWFWKRGAGVSSVFEVFTMLERDKESVYVLDTDIDRFKLNFLEQ